MVCDGPRRSAHPQSNLPSGDCGQTEEQPASVTPLSEPLTAHRVTPPHPFPPLPHQVADMKNSVKDRSNAQAACAANFISENLHEEYSGGWLHIDMAGESQVVSGAWLVVGNK